jgi:hypothetical protein
MLRVRCGLWEIGRIVVLILDPLTAQNFNIFRDPELRPQLADADVRQECWAKIRALPDKHHEDVGKFFEGAEITVGYGVIGKRDPVVGSLPCDACFAARVIADLGVDEVAETFSGAV